jgi:hypothetical protein
VEFLSEMAGKKTHFSSLCSGAIMNYTTSWDKSFDRPVQANPIAQSDLLATVDQTIFQLPTGSRPAKLECCAYLFTRIPYGEGSGGEPLGRLLKWRYAVRL